MLPWCFTSHLGFLYYCLYEGLVVQEYQETDWEINKQSEIIRYHILSLI